MSTAHVFLAMLALSVVVGCGSDLASVSGTVTIDGKPIVSSEHISGTVSFYREDGGGVPAIGRIDSSGAYALRTGGRIGAAPGAYRVGIAVKKISPPARPGDMPQATLITPPRYASVAQSGFREVVEPGSNTFNFAMSSKKMN